MISDNGKVAGQIIECAAGHTWTRTNKKGKIPKYCPEHRRFMLEQLSGRVKAPKTVELEWAEQEKTLNEDGYAARWRSFWIKTARLLAARGNSWSAVDVNLLDRYVRAERMAELHRLFAQDNPYHETSRGSVKPHPGWALAEREDQKANQLAGQLGLKDQTDARPRGGRAHQVDDFHQSRMQQSASEHDSVVPALGPDGEVL